jgi:hypothetical protein
MVDSNKENRAGNYSGPPEQVDVQNHKGHQCIVDPAIFCQEGYCSECWIAIKTND